METTTRTAPTPTPDGSAPHPRVRTDLKVGGAFLAVVIGGNLLWQATDAGLVSALAGR